MKNLSAIILALSLIFSSRKIFAREAYIDNKYYCEKGRGVWREFGNQCGDYCSAKIVKGICSPNLLMACDCGEGDCWNEDDNKCWNTKAYKNKIDDEIAKQFVEEEKSDDEEIDRLQKIIDEKNAAAKKADDDKIAADKKAADEKKAAEQKIIDDKKAEEDKKKLEEDKKTLEQKKEEEKKKSDEIKKEGESMKMDNNKTPPTSSSTNPSNGDIKIQDIDQVIKDLNNK